MLILINQIICILVSRNPVFSYKTGSISLGNGFWIYLFVIFVKEIA